MIGTVQHCDWLELEQVEHSRARLRRHVQISLTF